MGGEAWKACGKEAFRAGGRHSEEAESAASLVANERGNTTISTTTGLAWRFQADTGSLDVNISFLCSRFPGKSFRAVRGHPGHADKPARIHDKRSDTC